MFYTSCSGSNYVSKLKYWNSIDSLYAFGAGFTYNTCYGFIPNTGVGFQYPRTGNGLIRTLFSCTNPCSYYNSRTYPKNRLITTLTAGTTYCVKMWVNVQNTSAEAIDAFQILFSDVTIDTTKYITMPLTYLSPQITNTAGIITDTLNWIEVKNTFVANGTEKYLVIGNFKTDAVTSASAIPSAGGGNFGEYFIDDVSVIDFNLPAYAGPDKNINLGDSAFLGRPPEIGLECTWTTGTITVGTGGGIWVKPTSLGTYSYVVTQNICGNVKTDTVFVNMSSGVDENIAFGASISLFPQPAKDLVNIKVRDYYEPYIQIKVKDVEGRLMQNTDLIVRKEKVELETNGLSSGVYFLQISNSRGQSTFKKLIIAR